MYIAIRIPTLLRIQERQGGWVAKTPDPKLSHSG